MVTPSDRVPRTLPDGLYEHLVTEDIASALAALESGRTRAKEVLVRMPIPVSKVEKRWLKEPGFKEGYDALGDAFSLASMLIEARAKAKLSQEELAERMGTSQSTIARLESGHGKPSLSTLERFARATGNRVRVSLVPVIPRKKKARKAA